jgi:hypothetical protein
VGIKDLRQGLPVIGHAKIGEASPKSSSRKGAPYKFDHIELTGVVRDKEGRLIPDAMLIQAVIEAGAKTCGGCERSEALAEASGVKFPDGLPTQFGIFLPYNDLELNFPTRHAYFRGRTAYCTGDGEQAYRLKVTGEKMVQGRKTPVYGPAEPHEGCGSLCPDRESRRCKPNARLRFVLGIQENVGGCFEFRTTSWNSTANIVASLEMLKSWTGGILQGIPLLFEIGPQTVQPKDGGPANVAQIARVTFPGGPEKLLAEVRESLQIRAPMIAEIRQLEASIERGEWSEPEPEELIDTEPEDAEFTEVPEGAAPADGGEPEEPAQEEPEPPQWSAIGTGNTIGKGAVAAIIAQAAKRAHDLGIESGCSTILSYVLAEGGAKKLEEVTEDCKPEFLERVKGYQLPESPVSDEQAKAFD